jgi:hypothetical protein
VGWSKERGANKKMKDSVLILQLSQHKREHTKKETPPLPYQFKKKRPTKEKTGEQPLHQEGKRGGGQGMKPVPNVEKGNFN